MNHAFAGGPAAQTLARELAAAARPPDEAGQTGKRWRASKPRRPVDTSKPAGGQAGGGPRP